MKTHLSFLLIFPLLFSCNQNASDLQLIDEILSKSIDGHAVIECEVYEFNNVEKLRIESYTTDKDLDLLNKLKNLNSLKLFNCKSESGIKFYSLNSLSFLYLSSIKINQVSGIEKLVNLKFLSLQNTIGDSNHTINYIPNSIEDLSITENYNLTKLFIANGHMFKKLNYLNVENNFYLREIDSSFFGCINLKTIKISNCSNFEIDRILEYPENIKEIIVDNYMVSHKLDSICKLKSIELKILDY